MCVYSILVTKLWNEHIKDVYIVNSTICDLNENGNIAL